MSENFDELGELGDKIKKIIDTAVSTKDYRQMTEDIKQTVGQTVNSAVNSAVDSGSEAIKNGLNININRILRKDIQEIVMLKCIQG